MATFLLFYATRLRPESPFGATVFFHIPANYNGRAPVKLEFFDSQGQLVRSFDLHLKNKQAKELTPEEENAKSAGH